jgi:hypothetical protein
VVDDSNLLENHISANPIVDSGHDVLLTQHGGMIYRSNEPVIPIIRNGATWSINIRQLSNLDTKRTTCFVTQASLKSSIQIKVLNLHERMGHAHPEIMAKAIEAGTWTKVDVTPEQVRRTFSTDPCLPCLLAKRNKPSPPGSVTDPTTLIVGDLVSADVVGPVDPPSRSGNKYFHLFVDRATSFMHVYTTDCKDSFLTSLKDVYADYERTQIIEN